MKQSPLKSWDNFEILGKIPHEEVLKLMGKSLIYIGNSDSDGMPNTMLEAIFMGASPIQSNPGGATAELIQNGVNGLLIEDCEDEKEIKKLILQAIKTDEFKAKNEDLIASLDFQFVRKKVLETYNKL